MISRLSAIEELHFNNALIDNRAFPFHSAIINGDYEQASRYLKDNPTYLTERNQQKMIALAYLFQNYAHFEKDSLTLISVLNFLTQSGAQINKKIKFELDRFLYCLVEWDKESNHHYDLVKQLLEVGADPINAAITVIKNNNLAYLNLFLAYGMNLRRDFIIIDLDYAIDPVSNATDESGIHHPIGYAKTPEMIRRLMDYYYDDSKSKQCQNEYQVFSVPLLYAIQDKQYELVKELLAKGASPHCFLKQHQYALHLAVKNNDALMAALVASYLLDSPYKDIFDAEDSEHLTAMMLAKKLGYDDCINALDNPNQYLLHAIDHYKNILFYLMLANYKHTKTGNNDFVPTYVLQYIFRFADLPLEISQKNEEGRKEVKLFTHYRLFKNIITTYQSDEKIEKRREYYSK